MKYNEYLKTAHFINIKKRALEFWNNKCALCSNANKLHIHHNNYSCWFKEKDSDVIVLCENCHSKFHNHSNNPTFIKEIDFAVIDKLETEIAKLKNEITLLENNLPLAEIILYSPRWQSKETKDELLTNRKNELEHLLKMQKICELNDKTELLYSKLSDCSDRSEITSILKEIEEIKIEKEIINGKI